MSNALFTPNIQAGFAMLLDAVAKGPVRRARDRAVLVMDLSDLTDDELAHLAGQVNAEQRRRTPRSSLPARPVGHAGSRAGWTIQAGRMIQNEDKNG